MPSAFILPADYATNALKLARSSDFFAQEKHHTSNLKFHHTSHYGHAVTHYIAIARHTCCKRQLGFTLASHILLERPASVSQETMLARMWFKRSIRRLSSSVRLSLPASNSCLCPKIEEGAARSASKSVRTLFCPVSIAQGQPGHIVGNCCHGDSLSRSVCRSGRESDAQVFARQFAAEASRESYTEEVDEINSKFVEARDDIEMALESKETVYFDAEAETARTSVKAVLDKYEALLARLDQQTRGVVQRSMGLKMEQLKAELKQLELD